MVYTARCAGDLVEAGEPITGLRVASHVVDLHVT